jgi:hypothetical protein
MTKAKGFKRRAGGVFVNARPALSLSMIDHFFNVGEQNFGDLAVGLCDFDGRSAERLSAA